ncbi:MAG: hypothetical protein COA43_05475 [Robiginitomaculum sp.]|nr:MAG: hypothetical protein COA43_05475 [Robiginitomaculum sp.]
MDPEKIKQSLPSLEKILTYKKPIGIGVGALVGVMVLSSVFSSGASDKAIAQDGLVRSAGQSVSSASKSKGTDMKLSSAQRKQMKQLTKEMNALRKGLKKSGVSSFQDPNIVAVHKQKMTEYFNALQNFPPVVDETSTDKDGLAARKAFKDLRTSLGKELQRAKKQMAKSGDPQLQLAAIEANLKNNPMPSRLYMPITKAHVEPWLVEAKAAAAAAEESVKDLNRLAKTAKLESNNPGTVQSGAPYDMNDIRRLQNHAARRAEQAREGYTLLSKNLSDAMVGLTRDVPNYRGSYATQNFEKARVTGEAAVAVEKALGRKGKTAKDFLVLVTNYHANFLANQGESLKGVKLPKAKSKDKKRIKAAKSILGKKKYGFGKHGPIILITDKIVPRERKDKEVKVDDVDVSLNGDVTMSGSETTWTYKWDEFKFVTPILDTNTDDWYLWTITAKKFSSGGRRTPIGKWVSGKANKGPQILKKNF